MAYRPPGNVITAVPNTNLYAGNQTAMTVCVIGLGPITVAVTDEAVVRGSGSTDYLSAYANGYTGVVVSQIAKSPNVVSGSGLTGKLVSQEGLLYNLASATISSSGTITWATGSSADIPSSGSVYYVTYTRARTASEYQPKIYTDKQSIYADKGPENNTTGILSVAGAAVLENGAPQVMLVQASGSSFSLSAYQAAIDSLKAKTNIRSVVAVLPSGSSITDWMNVHAYLAAHVQQMYANPQTTRNMFVGTPSPTYAVGGFNIIGDAQTPNSYCYYATQLNSRMIQYVVHATPMTRTDANGNAYEYAGGFMAAAIAGLWAAQPDYSTPINNQIVTGFVIPDDFWNEDQMNQLAAAGCLVVKSKAGIVTVRDAITTDTTNADTQEGTIFQQEMLVRQTVDAAIYKTYQSKGAKITPKTPAMVAGTIAAALQSLVNSGDIYAYGKTLNPITGEAPISVTRDPVEPRRLNASWSVSYMYPLKWVFATFSTYF